MQITSTPLPGRFIRLMPLGPEHDAELKAACDADPEIWSLYPINMAGEGYAPWRASVDTRAASGAAVPFAIEQDGRCVGVTLHMLDTPNRRTEIGNTYLHPAVRGGMVNPESKLLMLRHAFACGAHSVALRVDALNMRSRGAVTKLGAHQDGILRGDRVTWTGRIRDTVIFSILESEWPGIEAGLIRRLEAFSGKA